MSSPGPSSAELRLLVESSWISVGLASFFEPPALGISSHRTSTALGLSCSAAYDPSSASPQTHLTLASASGSV